MTGEYTDNRYQDFISPRKERLEAYKNNRQEIIQEYDKVKELYQKTKTDADERINSLIQNEGYTKHQAKAMVKPAVIQMKQRLQGEKNKKRLALEKNHILIYPFHFFYKPVEHDGNGLIKPRFRVLLSFVILLAIAVFSLFFIDLRNTQFQWGNFGFIISKLFGPDDTMKLNTWEKWFNYMGSTAVPAIWKTFQMMFLATTIGSVLAIPFMILCSENIVSSKGVTRTFRVILNVIRTFPTMVLAVIGVAFFGIGTKAGIFAMVVFTMGIMIKLMYEKIETVDMHPFEAAISTGGSKPKSFVTSIVPQILQD